MQQQKRTRRVRAMAVGAVVASIVAVGAASGSASAAPQKIDASITVDAEDGVKADVKAGVGSMAMRSGIRW